MDHPCVGFLGCLLLSVFSAIFIALMPALLHRLPAFLRWLRRERLPQAPRYIERGRPLSKEQIAFHQAEFSALKTEVAELIKNTASNFQYAVVGSTAVFTWIVVDGHKNSLKPDLLLAGLWLPFLLSCFLVSLSVTQYVRIGDIAIYLRRLETVLGSIDLGWEKFFRTKPRTVGWTYALAWATLIFFDYLVGAFQVGS